MFIRPKFNETLRWVLLQVSKASSTFMIDRVRVTHASFTRGRKTPFHFTWVNHTQSQGSMWKESKLYLSAKPVCLSVSLRLSSQRRQCVFHFNSTQRPNVTLSAGSRVIQFLRIKIATFAEAWHLVSYLAWSNYIRPISRIIVKGDWNSSQSLSRSLSPQRLYSFPNTESITKSKARPPCFWKGYIYIYTHTYIQTCFRCALNLLINRE